MLKHRFQGVLMNNFNGGSPFPRRQNLYTSKLKGFADDNFSLNEWQKVLQTGGTHCGKRRNCSLRAIFPFPTVFF